MRATRLFSLVLMAAVSTVAYAQNVLINGDFETGDLTGWTWKPDPGSEPLMVATVATGPWNTYAFRVNPGHDGSGGDKGGTLTQAIYLQGGQNYNITGDLAIQNLRTGVNVDGGRITLFIGTTQLHQFNVGEIQPLTTLFDTINVNFVPPVSGQYELSLRFTRMWRNSTPSIYHWADNLVVVPEPGALVLLAAGLALLRRR